MKVKLIPITPTPILEGKDARVFEEKMKYNEIHKAPKEEFDRIMRNYKELKEVFRENNEK